MSLRNYLNYIYDMNESVAVKTCPLLKSIQQIKLHLLEILVLVHCNDNTILKDLFKQQKISLGDFSKCMIDYESGTPFDAFIGKSDQLYTQLTSNTSGDLDYDICKNLPISPTTDKIDFDDIKKNIENVHCGSLLENIKKCMSSAVDNIKDLWESKDIKENKEQLKNNLMCSMWKICRITQIMQCS